MNANPTMKYFQQSWYNKNKKILRGRIMKELIIKIYGLNYNELILLIFSLAIISFLFFTFIVIMFEKKFLLKLHIIF